jgi:hypothetical protein
MKPSSLLLLAAALVAPACGSIVDPNQSSGGAPHTATISGALSAGAPVPAGAHVTLVWRNGSALAVGPDVPVVNGQFTMVLDVPPDSYFAAVENGNLVTGGNASFSPGSVGGSGSTSSGSTGTDQGGPTPPVAADAGATLGGKAAPVRLQDTSGTVTGPLQAAVAGFIVYVDANGDGRLDLTGSTAASPDTILGGASDLLLVYLRGGSSLDYQRLADRNGAIPSAGFGLALTEGRWVGLDLADLTITSSPGLPDSVCNALSSSGNASGGGGVATPPSTGNVSSSGPGSTLLDGGGVDPYPPPGAPGLTCSADGRSFTYTYPGTTCPPPPPPGLCFRDQPSIACAGPASEGDGLASGQAPPPGWPCPVADSSDAGTGSGG